MLAWNPFSSHRFANGRGEQKQYDAYCPHAARHHQGVPPQRISLTTGAATPARRPRQGSHCSREVQAKVGISIFNSDEIDIETHTMRKAN
jgi:hypothetical protein